MNKLKMESVNMTQKNIDRIAEMFPQVVTEVADPNGAVDENGKRALKKAIDFEKLRLLLSAGTGDYVLVDDERERYEFTWVGKRQAMIDAAMPIRKTLRPCPDESKHWETTENLYIEGDNLEVLKLLQESYLGKVKVIYIDPPYNTGKDFVYSDNFTQNIDEYQEDIGLYDNDNNRLFQNTETNGRFHSDWCSMIYARLQLARNLLTDDGTIFISIDDNEVRNLRNICDEIFGESNFVNHIIWHKKYGAANDAKYLSDVHDHILLYCKNKEHWTPNLFERPETLNAKYKNPDNDPRGPWIATNLSVKTYSANNDYVITSPAGIEFCPPPSRCWVVSKEKYEEMLADNRITFGTDGMSRPYKKTFLSEVQNGIVPTTVWSYDEAGHNIGAKSELRDLFSDTKVPFDTPKPTKLIKRILNMAESLNKNDIILDFFGGSGTTADAVMQLNASDNGRRKYIVVQLNENTTDTSVAKISGFETVSQICKERIRRAGAKIEEELKAKNNGLFAEDAKPLDTGFRVFKLDTTNMKDVYYAAGQLSQKDLWDTVSNIKDDRKDIDLLYGCLLDWGVYEGLQLPHTTQKIENFTVHTIDSPQTDAIDLIACFDSNISETLVRAIATRKPIRALFRDSSFSDSANKINVFEIFKSISIDTTVKVI